MSLVEARSVELRNGGTVALHDVNIRIDPGEIITIIGPNGSGKSTLVRALVGALQPSSGTIIHKPDLRIGYVPQKLFLDPTFPLTVGRFLALPGRKIGESADALARVGLADIADKQVSDLSGGHLQRMMLARALLGEPELLVLDEPTQGLDQPATAEFYRLIEELRDKSGAAILLVSHDLHVVMASCDRVICLNGHICCEGTPEVVSTAPEYRALFGLGTGGAFALYRHEHDHNHTHD